MTKTKFNDHEKALLAIKAVSYPAFVLLTFLIPHASALGYSVAAIATLLALYSQFGPGKRTKRQAEPYLKAGFWTSVLSVAVWSPVYVLLHRISQPQMVVNSLTHQVTWLPHSGWLGFGLTPSAVIWFTVAYLLPVGVQWYRHFVARDHIAGMPKEKIFQ